MSFNVARRRSRVSAFFIFTLLAIGSPVQACLKIHARIGGAEFELGSLPKTKEVAEYGNSVHPTTLARSLEMAPYFTKLFTLHGRDVTGVFRPYLIPRKLAQSSALMKLLRDHRVILEQRENDLFIANYEEISPWDLEIVFKELFNAVGPFGRTLSLRKNPAAWKVDAFFDPHFDSLVPEVVSLEWRESKLIDFELPMARPVEHADEAHGYYRNLWLRLGAFKVYERALLEKAIKIAKGHMHWVPELDQLPADQRRDGYRAVVGFWGDRNDWQWIQYIDGMKAPEVLAESPEHLEGGSMLSRIGTFWDWSGNFTIAPLLRENYNRLGVTARGVLVADKFTDLERETVDPNFPPGFKYLPYGLRGKYGQKTIRADRAIPRIGIEARPGTLSDNIAVLPGKGATEIPFEHLAPHASDGPRGLISDSEALRARARELGVEPELVDELTSALKVKTLGWDERQQLAVLLLPFNDWLKHPLVERSLTAMPEAERAAYVATYTQAASAYSVRLNALMAARRDRNVVQKITDIALPVEQRHRKNLVYRHGPEETAGGRWLSNDQWFMGFVFSEAQRFVRDARLARLMQFPEVPASDPSPR